MHLRPAVVAAYDRAWPLFPLLWVTCSKDKYCIWGLQLSRRTTEPGHGFRCYGSPVVRLNRHLRPAVVAAYDWAWPWFPLLWVTYSSDKHVRTRQVTRYRATATLWRLQIQRYTASNEVGWVPNQQEHYTKCIILTKYEPDEPDGVPDERFGKLFLINDANYFDKSPNSKYLK